MRSFVIDSSALIAHILPDETVSSDEQEAIEASVLFAPELVRHEVANAILMAVKRKRITAAEGQFFADQFDNIEIERDSRAASSETVAIALRHGLTAYDAAYLELALRRGVPLLTRDRALAAAARVEGVAA